MRPLLTYFFYNLALFCPGFDWPGTHKGQKAFREMGYAAITLAIMGFLVGLRFRLKVLLPVLVLLLVGSAIFAVLQGWSFFNTLLAIVAAQTILQAGYFLGILVRSKIAQKRQQSYCFWQSE